MKEIWKRLQNNLRSNRLFKIIILICLILILIIESQQLFTQPKVMPKALNLRENPNPNAKIIREIPKGNRLKVLKKDPHTNWWYINADNQKGWVASWLIENPNYQPKENNNLPEATIVLDPGHGGNDSGTLASNQAMEKTYTLPTALKTYEKIKKSGAQVILTRDQDKTVSLTQRTAVSNDTKANLFISFHFNSSSDNGISKGFEIFKYHHNANDFATILTQKFNNLPLENRNIDFGNFFVLRENQRPAILIEMGFMNDPNDFKHITSHQYQDQVASDINESIIQYFK